MNNRYQGAFATPKVLDDRGLEVAVARSRNVEIQRAGPRVEAARSRAIALIASACGAFMRRGADMIVELRLDRGIVD